MSNSEPAQPLRKVFPQLNWGENGKVSIEELSKSDTAAGRALRKVEEAKQNGTSLTGTNFAARTTVDWEQ